MLLVKKEEKKRKEMCLAKASAWRARCLGAGRMEVLGNCQLVYNRWHCQRRESIPRYLHSRIGTYSKITCVAGDLSSVMTLCSSLGDCSGKVRIFKFLLHLNYQLVKRISRIQKPINKMT